MINSWMVGANVTIALAGLAVAIYFGYRAWTNRRWLDGATMSMFVAISAAGLTTALYRLAVVPVYFSRAIGAEYVSLITDYPSVALTILLFTAWAYLIFFKPIFYWAGTFKWFAATLVIVVCSTIIATAVSYFLAMAILRG